MALFKNNIHQFCELISTLFSNSGFAIFSLLQIFEDKFNFRGIFLKFETWSN